MKYIGLLDCNNFFVSCERLFRPDLVGKPTIVLSSNDGCVIARSGEVKDMGIPMGIPYFQIKAECEKNNVALFSTNFPLYRDISSRVMKVLEQEVGVTEQYSVDEAFFEIDAASEEEAVQTLKRIKSVVETKIGVPVSLGAAKSKTIAKYASEKEKKGKGVCFLSGDAWAKEVNKVSLHSVWGIGAQTSKKMSGLGIRTVADLLSLDIARTEKLFGLSGLRVQAELREQSVHKLGSMRGDQKSIMSTRSFKKETTSCSVLEDAVAYHVSHAATELREMSAQAQCIRVMIQTSRHGDWLLHGGTREIILPTPSNDTRIILKEALQATRDMFESNVPYKKAGIVLSMLRFGNVEQGSLFAEVEKVEVQKEEPLLMKTMDALNKRFGKGAVQVGRLADDGAWKTARQHISPRYTTKWDEIVTART